MKLGNKQSKNLKTPFQGLLPLFAPENELTFNLPPMRDNPELNSAIRRQDKPTAADAAFNKRNPFLSGMDKALQSERVKQSMQSMNQPRDWFTDTSEMSASDFASTRKYPAPAGMTRRDKPTKRDVMDYKQKKGRQPIGIIPSPALQQNWDVSFMQEKARSDAFERGKELAKSGRKTGLRGPNQPK